MGRDNSGLEANGPHVHAGYVVQESTRQESTKQESTNQDSTKQKATDPQGSKPQASGNKKQATAETKVSVESLEWEKFEIPDRPVTLLYPGQPDRKEKTYKPAKDELEVKVIGYRKAIHEGTILFSFNHSVLKEDMSKLSARLNALKRAERNTIAAVFAIQPKTSKAIRYGRYRGREFSVDFSFTNATSQKTTRWTRRTMIYIVGQNFYELSVVQHTDKFDEELARHFLDSFRIKNQRRPKK